MFPLIIATGPLTSDVAVGGHRGAGRRRSPVLLRRDQPDRPGRDDRHDEGVPRVALGPEPSRRRLGDGVADRSETPDARVRPGRLRRGRWRGRLSELPDDGGRVRRGSTTRSSRAESATVHDFDKEKFFEGCLPIEVMAHRGRDTLRFGPMKPVGLVDPRTGRTPYAVGAAAAGQPRRRSLQPRRLPDAVEVGRAGARAAR